MRNRLRSLLTVAALTVLPAVACAAEATASPSPAQQETKEQKDARMQWFREARFGMFIHWGIYSVPAGTYKGTQVKHIGEWIMNDAKIPVAEYAEYAKQFNPVKFDADAWVKTAKDAGMKYIVITSKHHDGFAMYHSKVDGYNIYDASPWHHDPLADLAAACKKYDMRLGFYYSQAQDWHHPGGAAATGHPDAAGIKDFKPVDDRNHWDTAQEGSFPDYVKNVAVPQVREILSNYGPISVLWWDTPYDMTHDLAGQLDSAVRELQPQIIQNNRLIHDDPAFQGDTETPEQFIPATGYPGRDWETCMTMNDTWGYKSWDNNWKSTESLLHNLIDIASKGGNYLLNVGPTSEGVIPEPSIDRLKQIGAWMKTNGSAIYATTPSPFRRYAFDGRVTAKGNQLFIHVFKWPEGGVTLTGLKTPLQSATFLADNSPATIKTPTDANGYQVLTISPPATPDPLATVVVLNLAGPAEVDNSASAVHASPDGSFALTPAAADLSGRKIARQGEGATQVVANWTEKRDFLSWDVDVKAAGDYSAVLTYSTDPADAGKEFSLACAADPSTPLTAKTASSDPASPKSQPLGILHLKPGTQTLLLKPANDQNKQPLMTFHRLLLTPTP